MNNRFLKYAWRNLWRNKFQSGINIAGLAVAIAVVLCVGIYVQSEYAYDNFHLKGDRLYRLGFKNYEQDVLASESPEFTAPIGPACKEEISGILNYTRFANPVTTYFSHGEQALKTDQVLYADSTFLDLFSFTLLNGNPGQVLSSPYSVVLTDAMAMRLYGSTDIVGKTIRMNFGADYLITGVVEEPPFNSSIRFNALISFSTLYKDPSNFMGWNGGMRYITYLELDPQTPVEAVEKQFPDFMWRHINESYSAINDRFDAELQPLSAIHLQHNYDSASLRSNLRYLSIIALVILLIACFNFINQSTAQAGKRTQEVGIRKTLGAFRPQLIKQFLSETLLIVLLAAALGALFTWELVPVLPNIFGKPLNAAGIWQWQSLVLLGAVLLVTVFGAGMYPALFLASLDPSRSLKGSSSPRNKIGLRNGLVIFQFVASMILITGTLIIAQQLRFAETTTLGFEKENVLVLPLIGIETQAMIDPLEAEMRKLTQVAGVAACSELPGKGFTSNGYLPEGLKDPILVKVVDVDDGFYELFGIRFKEGRPLTRDNPGDRQDYLVNEAFIRQMNWSEPIGKKISRNGEHLVKGVVGDFHFASLHEPIQPLIITCSPWNDHFENMVVKLKPGNVQDGVAAIQRTWKKILPDVPMDHWFLDDALNQVYNSERRLQGAISWCAILSVFIALLGIISLTTYSVEQRFKEIGIRKVLGASTTTIIGMFSRNYLGLVGFAVVISTPVSYYLMHNWLMGFAYRIAMPWWTFALTGSLALLFAIVIVTFFSIRAASSNPAQILKDQ